MEKVCCTTLPASLPLAWTRADRGLFLGMVEDAVQLTSTISTLGSMVYTRALLTRLERRQEIYPDHMDQTFVNNCVSSMSTLEGRHNRPGPVAVGTSTEALARAQAPQLPDLQRLEQEWRGRQDLSDSADDLRKGWAKLRAGYQKRYKKVVLRKSRQK